MNTSRYYVTFTFYGGVTFCCVVYNDLFIIGVPCDTRTTTFSFRCCFRESFCACLSCVFSGFLTLNQLFFNIFVCSQLLSGFLNDALYLLKVNWQLLAGSLIFACLSQPGYCSENLMAIIFRRIFRSIWTVRKSQFTLVSTHSYAGYAKPITLIIKYV